MGRFFQAVRSLGSSHGRDRLPHRMFGGRPVPTPYNCTCAPGSVCSACLTEFSKKTPDLIEEMSRSMTDFPQVPSYLNNLGYGELPKQVAEVLEHSGVIGYLTANDDGQDAFNKLVILSASFVTRDKLLATIDGELFIRSMCAGWVKMGLNETQTNSVASTADEYYKGVFAARRKAEEEAKEKAKSQPKNITSSGMKGFSEQAAPEDWDLAIGLIKGFRKWSIVPPNIEGEPDQVLKGSYGKNFLDHTMLPDGRRVGICHHNNSGHPPEEVPADNGCGCGWWAYWAPEEAQKHGGDGGMGSINVTIAVEGTGRVVIGQKGFRSQYVKVVGIAPDTEVTAEVLDRMAKFSRMHLLDAPVYTTVDALREGAGTDPVYGTLASRYPEIARHDNRVLATYVWFLLHVQRDLQLYLGKLTDKMKFGVDRPMDVYGRYSGEPATNQDELSEEHNYVKISDNLLGLERRTVERIIAERGETADDLLKNMGASYSSLG